MLQKFRELLNIMRGDPAVADELPQVRRLAIRALLWLLATEFFLVLQVLPVKLFFDELGRPDRSVKNLLLISLIMAAVYKAGTWLRARMSMWRNSTQWRMWRVWWGYGHRRGLRLSADWHVAHGTGEKDSIISKNIIKFESMIDELVFDTVPASARIAFTTLLMFFIGAPFGALSLLTMVIFVLVMWRSERHMKPLRQDFRARVKEVEKFGSELTSNWRPIKEMGREEDFCDQNDELLLDFWRDEIPRHKKWLKYYSRQEDVVTLSRSTLYALVAISFLWLEPSLGAIVLATTWMERSYSNYGRFSDFQTRMNEGLESLRELVNLMCLPATIQQAANPVDPTGLIGEVEFASVYFRYPEADDCTIQGVSFTAPAHTATALVGPSGCGKSTLIALLQRLYDPASGSIMIDGIDLRELDYDKYRRHSLSVVSQEAKLFDTSIFENIRVSSPSASEEEVYEAARAAYVDEFVEKLPAGYHTQVGDNAIRLSGGQKQRIAIARALLRKPTILIMDEATSSLDAGSQKFIQNTIDELIAERRCTVFIIAHRWSTIMGVDQVVVLQDGQIAEYGTHEELKRMNGLYMRLRNMEADGLLD